MLKAFDNTSMAIPSNVGRTGILAEHPAVALEMETLLVLTREAGIFISSVIVRSLIIGVLDK